MTRIVITGGPYTGKTTLHEHLVTRGYLEMLECATQVIIDAQRDKNMEPWKKRYWFQKSVLETFLRDEKKVNRNDVIFYDRFVPVEGYIYFIYHLYKDDIPVDIGEIDFDCTDELIQRMHQQIKVTEPTILSDEFSLFIRNHYELAQTSRVDAVFILDVIPNYQKTKERGETFEQRKFLHQLLQRGYEHFGYQVTEVPYQVENKTHLRAKFILDRLPK